MHPESAAEQPASGAPPAPSAELEQRLGVSRTALNNATRALLDEREIASSGEGRARRYRPRMP